MSTAAFFGKHLAEGCCGSDSDLAEGGHQRVRSRSLPLHRHPQAHQQHTVEVREKRQAQQFDQFGGLPTE